MCIARAILRLQKCNNIFLLRFNKKKKIFHVSYFLNWIAITVTSNVYMNELCERHVKHDVNYSTCQLLQNTRTISVATTNRWIEISVVAQPEMLEKGFANFLNISTYASMNNKRIFRGQTVRFVAGVCVCVWEKRRGDNSKTDKNSHMRPYSYLYISMPASEFNRNERKMYCSICRRWKEPRNKIHIKSHQIDTII